MTEKELIPYNRLIIIGNGFDLSQGLKSCYNDFLLDYFGKVCHNVFRNSNYEDEFIEITLNYRFGDTSWPDKYNEYNKVIQFVRDSTLLEGIIYRSKLFQELISSKPKENWIDIEKFYFKKLKQIYEEGESQNSYNNVKTLNEFLDNISKKLNDYLYNIHSVFHYNKNEATENYIDHYFRKLEDKDLAFIYRRNKGGYRNSVLNRVMLLNFNYTNVLEKAIMQTKNSSISEIVNIHGEVNSEINPIIFGYGDDTSEEYRKLELRDEDEYLRNIKSSKYSRTNNYHKMLSFLDKQNFEVFIVGHSCGLSDKTLLRTIFEHEKCLAIKIFHHQGYNEHLNKGIAISRHFSDKVKMREKVLPFDENAKIIQRVVK